MPDDVMLTDAELQAALADLPGWELREGWLRQTYEPPDWPRTVMRAQTVGYLAEAAWHPRNLSLGYARVTVTLQTQRVKGLTHRDVALGQKIDEVVTWKPPVGSPLDGFPKNWVH